VRVELKGVKKSFGKVAALRDVSLQLESGSRAALVGPNGSGKSTLTRVLLGMLEFEGEVLLDGRRMPAARDALATRIAYVPQITPRLAAPVAEIVRAVATLRSLEPRRIEGLAADLDLDLAALRSRAFRDLSGGMRQKLLLALALASDPELLVLDEPTASLDPVARQRFFACMAALPRSPTLVLCSHRLEEIRHLVDRLIVLEDGRTTFLGSPTRYLHDRPGSVVEVLASGEGLAAWLSENGFTSAGTGWWSRAIAGGERASMLRRLAAIHPEEIADVLVRDGETLLPHRNGIGS